jgi:hypothetical protein
MLIWAADGEPIVGLRERSHSFCASNLIIYDANPRSNDIFLRRCQPLQLTIERFAAHNCAKVR